jgi:monoamine oxidase
MKPPKVVIFGAGIAGLSAAYYLQRAGFQSTVYEARNRIGGRVFSQKNIVGDGLVTELGGEFIDGSHADMLRYAKWFNLDLIDIQTADERKFKETYYFGGKVRLGAEQVKAAQMLLKQLRKDKNLLSDGITFRKHSLADVRLDWTSLSQYLQSVPMDGWLHDLISTFYTTEYGLDPDKQSALNLVGLMSTDEQSGELKFLGDEESIERYKIRGGNDQIVHTLAQKVEDIHLDTYLEAIEQKAQSYQLHLRHGGKSEVVAADYVVIAIPFSTLRRCHLDIPLTSVQRDAINNLTYGTNAKVIVGTTERCWRKQGLSGSFTVEGAQTGWDSSRGQAGTQGSLTFYLGGQTAVKAGQGEPQAVADQLVNVASAVFPELPQKLNGKVFRQHWPTDPWVQGSYACYSVGNYTRIVGAFTRPVNNVYFAGEHLSLAFQGYMNGGVETGRKAAEQVIRRLS